MIFLGGGLERVFQHRYLQSITIRSARQALFARDSLSSVGGGRGGRGVRGVRWAQHGSRHNCSSGRGPGDTVIGTASLSTNGLVQPFSSKIEYYRCNEVWHRFMSCKIRTVLIMFQAVFNNQRIKKGLLATSKMMYR